MTLLESLATGAVLGITAAVAIDVYDDLKHANNPNYRKKKQQRNKQIVENLDYSTRRMIWGD